MDYELIRSRRKTLAVKLRSEGTVEVRAPLLTPRWEIERFLLNHRDWVEKQQRLLRESPRPAPLSREEKEALRRRAKQVIPERVACFAPRVGVRFGQITVRFQKSKWGSCSARGNLNFNALLLLAPGEVLDYVVVHELCHLLEMNHSPRFWAQVARVLPDYEQSRKWLRQHGAELMARLPKD